MDHQYSAEPAEMRKSFLGKYLVNQFEMFSFRAALVVLEIAR